MRVEFLGTGGFHPNERRHTACVMFPEIGLIFDGGSAAFRVPKHIQTTELDLFLSHAHLDHICGLTYLITPPLIGQIDKLKIHGRPEFLHSVKEHLFSELIFPIDAPFEFDELKDSGEKNLSAGYRLAWQKLAGHPGGSTAFKLDFGDYRFAYVTDTTVDGSYTDFIRDVDVLVHECYFADENKEWADLTGHTHSSALANLAAEADVKLLVAVHVDPLSEDDDPVGLDQMKKIFPNIILAEDGLTLDLPV